MTMSETALPSDHGLSPLRLAVRKLRKHRLAMVGLWILLTLYLVAIFADFLAPYGYNNQVRELEMSPSTPLHFFDENGTLCWPYVHPRKQDFDEMYRQVVIEDKSVKCPLRFFVFSRAEDQENTLLALAGVRRWSLRLFGFEAPPQPAGAAPSTYFVRFYLMGADISGRDIFSRICYAARISLTIGLCGASVTFILGMLIGGTAGYFGGKVDGTLMRLCEMIMLLPGFYLLLILRHTFPADMDSVKVYFAVVLIMSLIGWAGFARVIRGMVLSIRRLDFVQAARAGGLTHFQIVRRHVLPNTLSYAIVSVTMSIPAYILGESALSLLGLGIMDPVPSWGNMLGKAMDIPTLDQHPFVLWPGVFIFLTVMAFNFFGDGLRDAFDPKTVMRE